jgi:hypothetical protein
MWKSHNVWHISEVNFVVLYVFMLRYSSVEAYYWSKRELKKFRFDFVEFLLNLF